MGDSSPDADKLMRSQGVRALPSFHFWKNKKQARASAPPPLGAQPSRAVRASASHLSAFHRGATHRSCRRKWTPALHALASRVRALPSPRAQVDSVSGAKTQALQDAIEQHM